MTSRAPSHRRRFATGPILSSDLVAKRQCSTNHRFFGKSLWGFCTVSKLLFLLLVSSLAAPPAKAQTPTSSGAMLLVTRAEKKGEEVQLLLRLLDYKTQKVVVLAKQDGKEVKKERTAIVPLLQEVRLNVGAEAIVYDLEGNELAEETVLKRLGKPQVVVVMFRRTVDAPELKALKKDTLIAVLRDWHPRLTPAKVK